jgi:hypothetical protein
MRSRHIAAKFIYLTWRTDGSEVCVVLEEVSLELGEDVFSVGVLPERGAVRPDLVHEHLPLRRLGDVDHFLNNIVGVLVLHHDVQRTLGAEK